MNENIDLTKILEGCPRGTKLYSPIFGEVEFDEIDGVFVKVKEEWGLQAFLRDGTYVKRDDAECLLFPSKEQRDWSKFERFWDKPKIERFDPNTLQPFDRVLAREIGTPWEALLFSHKSKEPDLDAWYCSGYFYDHCIPYNEDTKHLVGTTDDCPDYYKWWE